MARVTLQTIADRLGVSRMTVSNAFSRPDQLSAELRERILATAAKLGYAGPDPAARALARGTTGAVGVLLTDSLRYAFTDEVATGFLGAIADELAPTGLALTLLTTEAQGDAIPARDVAIDGAVVYSCRPRSEARDWLLRRKLPLVFVDQDPVPGIPSVNVDDRGGAAAAARHLLALGHRDIGIVSILPFEAPPSTPPEELAHPERERIAGWLDELVPAGVDPPIVKVVDYSPDAAAEVAGHLLDANPGLTAVLCFSDLLAQGVVRVARDRGLEVPADLSVVGFDDSPMSRFHDPPLTTVRQDVAEKGRLAAALLTAEIGRAAPGSRRRAAREVLPTELVVRDSTAPPRGR